MNASISVALVTGASSGIGLEIASVLAELGHNLLLVARSAERSDGVARQSAKDTGVTVQYPPVGTRRRRRTDERKSSRRARRA